MPVEKSPPRIRGKHGWLIHNRNKPPMFADVPRRRSLVDLFYEFSKCQAECLQYDNGYRSWKYTYAQVGRAAHCLAARLHEHHIGKGDKAILWSENRPEWIVAFWGCVLAGVVVVPIDYRTSLRFLLHVQGIVDAHVILIGEEVQLRPWDHQPPAWRLSELEWSAENYQTPPVRIETDDIVEIVFTSGATGEPKGVPITHGNILANIVSPEQLVSRYAKWFRPVFPLRFLSLIPLSHMFGQVITLFILPLIPGVAVFIRGYSPHEIVRQVRKRRVSVVIAVPKILQVLKKHVVREFSKAARLTPNSVALGMALVPLPPHTFLIRMEVLGIHRWRSAAFPRPRGILVRTGIRRRSRLRSHGDGARRYLQQSVRYQGRNCRQTRRGSRNQDRSGRRNTSAR